ncbi:MAG: substrate-binding domain-containing protein [Clostridiaceae bacterium]|jgi:diguanylate cyclase (GGDEF)-like protein|nr:substrate-binding domain-containing protein [Clostridiaceae bacterium]
MRIGLVVGNLDDGYYNRIAESLSQEFTSLNASLVIFECADFDYDTPSHYVLNMLCSIAACNFLDGIIIAPSTFLYHNIEDLIREVFEKTSKPVVSIGIPIEGIPSIILDYKSAFDEVISHFISHNIKNFAYISGPLSQPVFRLRYEAFLDSVRNAGLEISSDLLLEGTTGYMSGYNCAKGLAPLIKNGTIKGVVCASDHIALSAIRCFSENNINVPSDVEVSGFDNTGNAYFSAPYLTTINRNLKQIFKKAISVLFEQIFGNNSKLTYYLAPELTAGITSGCKNKTALDNNLCIPWSRFHGLRATSQATKTSGIIPRLTEYLTENNISRSYIVKYCNPIKFEDTEYEFETQKGILFYGFSKGKTVEFTKPFSTMGIIPSHLFNEIKEPMHVKPIFTDGIKFGFLFISISWNTAPLINDLYNELYQYFSGSYFNQEYMRLKKEIAETRESLMLSNKRLNELTVKDNLYKLSNLRHLASNMLQKRRGITGEYYLIIVDIDNYYEINERFGFSEGEYVISCVSNILTRSIRDDDYFSHQSFERYILLVKNIQNDPTQIFDKRFMHALNELNRTIDKPYHISFSWGYASAKMESNIDDAYVQAEKKLFEVKQKKSTISPV